MSPILAKIGLPVLIEVVSEALGRVENPLARSAEKALREVRDAMARASSAAAAAQATAPPQSCATQCTGRAAPAPLCERTAASAVASRTSASSAHVGIRVDWL